MRINVKKFLFIGSRDNKEKFFKKAQDEGFINFIDTRQKPTIEPISEDIRNTSQAIRILRHYPPIEQEENVHFEEGDKLVKNILSLHEEHEKILEHLRILDLEISRIEVFGQFSLEDIKFIENHGNCKIQYFAARPSLFQDLPLPEGLIFIASEHGLDYYMSFNSHPVLYEKMAEIKIEHSLNKLKDEYSNFEEKQREIEVQLKGYVKFNDFLHHLLIAKLNRSNLSTAQAYVQEVLSDSLFAIEGWVPENKVNHISPLIENLDVFAEEIAIEPSDNIPTYLENSGFNRLGEDLINIYDTPSSTDNDPSLWVLGSFVLFFSFIVGDAGYGLVYLLIALLLRYKLTNLKALGKRILNLFTVLSVGCIIWGMLTNSFFGMPIEANNPIRKISLLHYLAEKKVDYFLSHRDETYNNWIKTYPELAQAKKANEILSYVPSAQGQTAQPILSKISDTIMFELALFIGVVHVIISLLRYLPRNWNGAGWIAFIIGAYLYFPLYLHTPSLLNYVGGIDLVRGGQFGYHLMMGGIIAAILLSIVKNGIYGIFDVMVLIQIFADILSYLRLYALGLAGAIVSGTINEIAATLPLAVAILLILVSHLFNIVLGTMSGVIHGLRLNFIEWYHYSFEGGGKKFKPLKLLKIE